MVRLKGENRKQRDYKLKYFNSTMVRLKGRRKREKEP